MVLESSADFHFCVISIFFLPPPSTINLKIHVGQSNIDPHVSQTQPGIETLDSVMYKLQQPSWLVRLSLW